MNIEIANRLVNLRKKSGLSQEELAAKLGLSRQAVSKWERAEASPDTDNLICLAKLYGVSLDDLLDTDQSVDEIVEEQVKPEEEDKEDKDTSNKDKAESPAGNASTEQEKAADTSEKTKPEEDGSADKSEVHIDSTGIHFKSGKDQGTIDPTGIHVTSGKSSVHIDSCGIRLDPEVEVSVSRKRKHAYNVAQSIVSSTVALLAVAAYILLGTFIKDPRIGWGTCWLVFLLIPIASSFVEALKNRRFCTFAFPVLVAGLYVLFGMLYGAWHPEWVMFFAIPIYYSIFSPIDKAIHGRWSIDIEDNDDDDDDDEDKKKKDDDVIDVDVK